MCTPICTRAQIQHPFILTLSKKAEVLNLENRVLQTRERRAAMVESILRGDPGIQFLRLRVSRNHIVRDAITQLSSIQTSDPMRLRKRLRIEFLGEEGLDEGGVQKEFFQLILRDLFDPKYGMFTYNDETHLFWFNPNSLETPAEFRLLGILLGLALYNNVFLGLSFPVVVYKKVTAAPPCLGFRHECGCSL